MDYEKIKRLEAEFDFDELFSGQSKYGAALRVITPSQEITLPTLSHADAAKIIMKEIYDDTISADFNESFPDELNEKCAVVILMMNGSFEIVYVPSVINSYQFDRLFNFNSEILEFCKRTGRKIDIHTNVFYNDKRELSEVFDGIKERINDDFEFPLENHINTLNRSI